ncbi:MAG: hypothetical protein GTO14_20985 [Anaerolineales bacterium]|nr:hypothetical protein [Anaerolineales bacterium]
MQRKAETLERLNRYTTLLAFALGGLITILAPILALSWRNQPFPGFMLEHTLVLNDRTGQDWSGRSAGLRYPYLVTRIAGVPVSTSAEFNQILSTHTAGDEVNILTRLPDGRIEFFPSIQLKEFSNRDLFQMFWLPYLVGIAYLCIGIWIYLARGKTRPGRALSFFCASVAVTTGLLFDVLTTHAFTMIWITAVSLLGGTLISLALRFPVEWKAVYQRPWLLAVPYVLSLGLAIWGSISLWMGDDPWMYLSARAVSYRYIAAATLFFFGLMFYRARSSKDTVTRRQARLVLLGSVLAFLPILFWLITPLFGVHLPFRSATFLPGLLLFPLSVGLAIIRYRLLEIDSFVNRAIAYGLLTAILAGIFSAVEGLSQRLFILFTGEKSDAAIVMTTLVIASAFNPMRSWVNSWLVRNYRGMSTSVIKGFGDEVRFFIQMNDVSLLAKRFLEETMDALTVESGAVVLFDEHQAKIAHTHGPWRGHAFASIPLECEGERYGVVLLGPRKRGRAYRYHEIEELYRVATQVAHAIQIARGLHARKESNQPVVN